MTERKKNHKCEKSDATQVGLGLLNGLLLHQLLEAINVLSNMISDSKQIAPISRAIFRYYCK